MMRKHLHIVLLGASHLVAFGIGWWVWSHAGPQWRGGRDVAASTSGEGEVRQADRRRSLEREDAPGDRLLDRVLGENFTVGGFAGWEQWAKNNRERYGRLLSLADATPPADDPAAAALAAFDKGGDEAKVRLIHWLRIDPVAAVNAIGRRNDSVGAQMLGLDAVMAITAEKGPAEVVGWLRGDEGGLGARLRPVLARQMAGEGDLAGVRRLKDDFEPAAWLDFCRSVADSVPFARADEMLAFCREENVMGRLANFAAANGPEGARWLVDLMASGSLDESVKEQIRGQGMFAEMMWRTPTLAMEERLAVLGRFRPGRSKEEIIEEIATRDVAGALGREKDYRHAFRSQEMSAEQVMAEVVRQLPYASTMDPDALRTMVFNQLAKEDGVRAMDLLAGKTGEEKQAEALDAVSRSFQGVNPQQLYDFLSTLPGGEGSPEAWQRRLDVWTALGQRNHTRLGANYVGWVKQLPEGLDKDMAAYALVKSLGSSQPEISNELTAGIRDARVREQLLKQTP